MARFSNPVPARGRLSIALTGMILSLLLFTSTTFAACTNFSPVSGLLSGAPNDQIYTATALRSFRVSPVVNCSGAALGTDASNTHRCNSTQCGLAVQNNYLVNFEAELNITVSDDQKRDILALVKQNTTQLRDNPLYDFNRTMTLSVGGIATCINEGQEGYWGLTPGLICAEGTLTSCSGGGGGDSPAEGTAIRACGVNYFSITDAGLGMSDLGPNYVTTGGFGSSPAPANATVIVNSSPSSGATPTPTPPNSAVSSRSVGLWTWIVATVAVMFAFL